MGMSLTAEQIDGLGVALNEATIIEVLLNTENFVSVVRASVLTLPEDAYAPEPNPYVQIALRPTGRIAASLRLGDWDDEEAPVEPFEIEHLSEIVSRVCGFPIYGWEFVDVPEDKGFAPWSDRLSLDWRSGVEGGLSHSLTLFQEGGGREWLDLRIWFDELGVFDSEGEQMPTDEFIAGGKRWWDAFYADDPRVADENMAPLSSPRASRLLDKFFRGSS
jgi:hypothetical protein